MATYPVERLELRRWRWRLRAAARSTGCSLPVADLQALLDDGATLNSAATALEVPRHLVTWLADQGRLLIRPRSPGYPCPDAWASACTTFARQVRQELADEMLATGLTMGEVAEVVGVSPRALRYWRSRQSHPEHRPDEGTEQHVHPPGHRSRDGRRCR